MSTRAISLPRTRPRWILARHTFKELLPPTGIGFMIFTFLLLMRYLLRISELWINYGAELTDVLWSIVYSVPHIVVLTLPMAVLVGGLIAFGRMSADFEIVALRALGVSLFRLLPPVIVFGAAAWAINSYMFMVVLPWGNINMVELQWQTVANRALTQEMKPRVFHDSFPGVVLYVEDVVRQGQEWRNVFAALTETDPPTILRAERAYPILADDEERRIFLRLERGTVISSAEDPANVTLSRFESRTLPLWNEGEDSLLGGIRRDERSMYLSDLRAAIRDNESQDLSTAHLWVEVHKKFALPFACLVFAIMSIPLGISTQRQTTAIGYAIGTGVIIVYYFFVQNGEQQAEAHALPAWLGIWSGNLVLGVVAAIALWNKARERDWGVVRALRPHGERAVETLREGIRHWSRRLAGAPATARTAGARLRFPRTLDRYILYRYLTTYALAFVALIVVWSVVEWLDLASWVDVPALLPEYFRYRIFFIAFNVIPIAAVVTVLATFSLMTKRNEIVAALAGGISLYRLMLPILLPATILCGVQYALQDYVLPNTTRQEEIVKQEMDLDRAARLQRERTWVFSEGDRVFHFDDYLDGSSQFRGLRVYYLTGSSGPGIARMEYADRAEWTGERWEGHDGWRRHYVAPDGSTQIAANPLEEFKFSVLPIPEAPEYFAQEPRRPEEMSAFELRRHIAMLRQQGFDPSRALVDFHMKLSMPAVTLVMTLVGMPFAFKMGRRGTLTGIAVGVALVIVYWIAFALFRAIGYGGQLPPMLAAWSPHLLFLALGGFQALGVRT